MFLLDSLGNRHPKALQCLQQYLQAEAKERMGFDIEQDGCKPTSLYGKVPRQRNYCDCGVYLLHYMEVFLSNPQKYVTMLAVSALFAQPFRY
jgi:Ulp1 family protease